MQSYEHFSPGKIIKLLQDPICKKIRGPAKKCIGYLGTALRIISVYDRPQVSNSKLAINEPMINQISMQGPHSQHQLSLRLQLSPLTIKSLLSGTKSRPSLLPLSLSNTLSLPHNLSLPSSLSFPSPTLNSVQRPRFSSFDTSTLLSGALHSQ